MQASAPASSANTDWPSAIAALEEAANDAFVRRDLARLEELRRRFTNVWRREDGRSRLHVRHANVVADVAAGKPSSSRPDEAKGTR